MDFRLKPGFTLMEVLVTIAISSILFLSISSLLTNVVSTNTLIKDNITLNDEKETVYLLFKNFLDEAQWLIYPVAGNANGSFIVLNSSSSALLPFTAFVQTSSANGNSNASQVLKVYNFSIGADGITPTASVPAKQVPASGKIYSIDYTNNRIIIGTLPANPSYCQNQTSDNCILAGFQQNTLVYGTSAFAPFIGITKPTDICFEGSTLHILSPYELREYRINITDATLPITTVVAGNGATSFPSYFSNTTTCQVGTVTFPTIPSFAGFEPVQSRYKISDLQLKRNVYPGVNSPRYELDQITYALQKPQNTNQNNSVSSPFFLFKLFKK